MIHRIRINRICPDLSERQVLSFRIGGDQETAEAVGNALRTKWMREHPGVPTTMVTDWPRPEELGETVDFVTPSREGEFV